MQASTSPRFNQLWKWYEFILSRAVPLSGTLGETYLCARGLTIPASQDLLFHPDLTHWETKTGFPALIGIVRSRAGEILALHRTYLRPDGSAKADVPEPKKMLGKVAGGAVRLAGLGDDGRLGLCEGIETGLSVMSACPELPVWATLSTSHLEQVEIPPQAKQIIILADNDSSGAGLRAAETAARLLKAEGRKVGIALPLEPDTDFNDLLLREGPDAVKAAVERTEEWTPLKPMAAVEPCASHSNLPNLPVGFPGAGQRPVLRADNGDLAALAAHTRAILADHNDPPWLFRMGAMLAWVARDDDGRAMAIHLNDERLKLALAQLIDWRKKSREGDLVPAYPPAQLVKALLATPNPDLPVLAGIVAAPVFGRSGELVTQRGYYAASRLLHEPPEGFELPPLSEGHAKAELDAARALLLDNMLGDFPFTSEAERAHALALLLLPFVRPMIEGPTPLHLIEKPTPGTGATLMVDVIAVVATGHSASIMTEGKDEEEWRKRITAKLREAPLMVVLDNLRNTLDAASVAAALTAPYWEDRILGRSDIVRIPVRCAWVATGNNPRLSNKIARRAVRIRLDAHVDRPWQRDDFRHPNLLTWVQANCARLVAACLTLGRAWVASGKPRYCAMTLGSFEAWSEIVGGILDVAGVPGFLGNTEELYESSDIEGLMWRGFVAAWWDRFGTAAVGTADLFPIAGQCEPPLPLGSGSERSQRTRLGKALGQMRDRVFRLNDLNLRIRAAGVSHQAQRWVLMVEEMPHSRGEHGERFDSRRQSATQEGEHGERFSEEFSATKRGTSKQRSPTRSPDYHVENESSGEHGEGGERFSMLTHARTRTHACEYRKDEKCSPPSPSSPTDGISEGYSGEHSGEHRNNVPLADDLPVWLKEVL